VGPERREGEMGFDGSLPILKSEAGAVKPVWKAGEEVFGQKPENNEALMI